MAAASKVPWVLPRLTGYQWEQRPGQLDPGIVLYLISEKGMTAEVVKVALSGMRIARLSRISNDVQELLESAAPSAALALDYFVYRVGLNTGMLAAALGGLDAFVFTAGIGEKSAQLRSHCGIALLG